MQGNSKYILDDGKEQSINGELIERGELHR